MRFSDGCGLHHVRHDILANRPPHLLPDPGREAVVEARPDAGLRHLVGVSANIGPSMGHPRRGRTRHDDLRYVGCAQQCLHDGRQGGAADAMGAWIFGMHGCVVDRLPGRIALGCGIAIDVAIANGCNRTPELVVILCVHHRDIGIGQRHRGERHEARAVEKPQLLRRYQLANQRISALRAGDQPEAGILGLPGGALAAVLTAKIFDLVVVGGPFLAGEPDRRLGAELRRALEGKWRDIGPGRADGDRGRNVDAGLGLRALGIRRSGPVVASRFQNLGRDRLAEPHALRFCLAFRQRGEI